MIASDNIFPEVIKIEEKLSDSDSFQDNLSLNFFHNFFDGKESFRYFFINIKLLSDGVSMEVFNDVSGGIKLFFVGDNAFHNISLDFFDILNIGYEIGVSDFFGVDASGILFAQDVDKNFIFDKIEIV